MLPLYRSLHPEDTDVEAADLRIVTLENVLLNGMRNDLGFAVRDKLIILLEAQSTWSQNIVLRELLYLVDSWQQWLDDTGQTVHQRAKVAIPKPELYAVFPGKTGPEILSLANVYFDGDDNTIDCKVCCIYSRPRDDILGQYIRCSEICDEEIKKWGRQYTKAATEIRRRCIEENVLTDFLGEIGGELERMVEYRSEVELRELVARKDREDALAEGEARGDAKRARRVVVNLIRQGLLSHAEIAAVAEVPLATVDAITADLKLENNSETAPA